MTGLVGPDGETPLKQFCGYSGAGPGFGGQLTNWQPGSKSADRALLPDLVSGNARSDDLVRNHALAAGGVQLHIDNIVGSLFRLNYKPNTKVLGMDERSARDFSTDVEAAFTEYAESPYCYVDAERKRTFTALMRAVAGGHCHHGEAMAAVEWISRPGSMYRTAVKLVSPRRVSNPDGKMNGQRLRAGVVLDRWGAATHYHVREDDYNEFGLMGVGKWRKIRRETQWGRTQFIHAFEPLEPGQTRGANLLLSSMEQMQSLSKLQNIKLQNALVNAMYAAVIESELDSEQAFQLISGENGAAQLQNWMAYMGAYHEKAGITMDGVKIPHMVPGEHLKFTHSANADNGFTDLEASMVRYIAAGLGVSYEQLSRDYSKVSYSSARASINESWRYVMGKRKTIVSYFASLVFAAWFEEALHKRILTPPKSLFNFYERKAGWVRSDWIGAGKLSIDGLKEVKEAVLKIESGLSTYEKELALMGEDYQEVFEQQVREVQERKAKGLPPPSWITSLKIAPDETTIPEAA